MPRLYVDTETYSTVDLKAAGTYKYAANAEVMMITWAYDDGSVRLWDYTLGTPPPDFSRFDGEVIAHHAMFDRNVLRLGNLGIAIPRARWRCTMVQAMQHALPGGLDALGRLLVLPQDMQKVGEGKKLIQRFCRPHDVRTNRRAEALRAVPLAARGDIGSMVYFGADIKKAVKAVRVGFLAGIWCGESRSYVDSDGKRHGSARHADLVMRALDVPDEERVDTVRYDHLSHPDEWMRFKDYARQDVVALREIHRRLPLWNWQPNDVALWHLDQQINDRGFAVDGELTAAGARAVVDEKRSLGARFAELTGGLQPSQRARVQEFVNTTYDMHLTSTAKHVLEPLAADASAPDAVREIARIVSTSNMTSTAKYAALAAATCSDGRFRGGLQFAGASRTRRWAGRKFQPHNLPSRGLPPEEMINAYIHALKAGCHRGMFDDLMLYGSAALRGVLVSGEGMKLAVSDLSNIEGRILSFLAGEKWKLQAFCDYDGGTGPDLYNITASGILGQDPYQITKKDRNVFGKVPDLALGFEGGVGALQTFAQTYGVSMAEQWEKIQQNIDANTIQRARDNFASWGCQKAREMGINEIEWTASEAIKLAWRSRHPATRALWYACKDAMTNAIANPGSIFNAGAKMQAGIVTSAGQPWLLIKLPSGRYLTYFDPQIDGEGNITYQGYGDNGKGTRVWGRQYTYGGKMVENACQAVAGDVLRYSMSAIEAAGYEIVLTVHDEVVAQTPDRPEFNADALSALLSMVPDWAPELPLAAAGFEAYRYKKED